MGVPLLCSQSYLTAHRSLLASLLGFQDDLARRPRGGQAGSHCETWPDLAAVVHS
jgi:hypothetical protein